MKNIKVVWHYYEYDPEFHSDYASVELFVDNKLVLDLQDAYHDHSQEKIDGFCEAFDFLGIPYNYEEVNVADADGC